MSGVLWKVWPHGEFHAAAQGLDDLLLVTQLLDAQSKILADFHGLAQAMTLLFTRSSSGRSLLLKNSMIAPGPQTPHDFAAMHFPLGQADDQGNLQVEDAVQFSPAGRRRWGFRALRGIVPQAVLSAAGWKEWQ